MTTAAKRPEKTTTFLDEIEKAMDEFDDEVSSPSHDERKAAYNNLATSYKTALMTIWDKANVANMETVISTVADPELKELRRMARLLEPSEPQPQVIQEERDVPDLDNILGALTSKIPNQTLKPEASALIGRLFSNLAEAHSYQRKAANDLSNIVSLVTLEQLTLIMAVAVPLVIT